MELKDPGLQFIAEGEPAEGLDLPWRGIHERLALPLNPVALKEAVDRRVQVLSRLPLRYQRPTSFFSLLPAKAGAGASTLASCLAKLVSAEKKTLLFDLDLCAGTIGFHHQSPRQHSLPEILGHVAGLNEELWSQMISQAGKLHVLSSQTLRDARLDSDAFGQLLDFLRTIYDVVFFDMSGNLESYSLQAMHSSSQVLLVTTPEIESLHLGRFKAQELGEEGLGQRLGVLVNRVHRADMLGRKDIEDILKLPVKAEFPSDYRSVRASLNDGTPLRRDSALSKALARYVPVLFEEPQPKTKRFIEYVTLPFLAESRQLELRAERWN